ncbi:MAG: ABC transporter ATP-binding protein [Acidimicrobiales bacterium]
MDDTTPAVTASILVDGVTKCFDGAPVLREVSLRVAPGSVVALLGPSGCGKTTLLRTIAGLEVPDAGTVSVAGRVLTSPTTLVPPERRHVGMVFQDWALFPHLSVAANIGYGLDRAGRRSGRVEEALALVGLSGLGDRSPGTLSGGQQQRVALARALAPRPAVLLLDEPFSNLDASLRVEVRTEVHRLLSELAVTTVFVTHDQEEAFVLGDEVAVMRDGVIEQQAPPAELYARPVNPWVARFVGAANIVAGRVRGGVASTPLGSVPVATLDSGDEGVVEVLVRPEAVAVEAGGSATVTLVEFYGHDTVYELRLPAGELVRARVGSVPHFATGDRVTASYAGLRSTAWPGAGGTAETGVAIPVHRPTPVREP